MKYTIRAPEPRPPGISYKEWLYDRRGDIRVFDVDGNERKEICSVSFKGNPTNEVCFGVLVQLLEEERPRVVDEIVPFSECKIEGDWRTSTDFPLYEKVDHQPQPQVFLRVGDIARLADGSPADYGNYAKE